METANVTAVMTIFTAGSTGDSEYSCEHLIKNYHNVCTPPKSYIYQLPLSCAGLEVVT